MNRKFFALALVAWTAMNSSPRVDAREPGRDGARLMRLERGRRPEARVVTARLAERGLRDRGELADSRAR